MATTIPLVPKYAGDRALRSDPENFPANAEAEATYFTTTLPDDLEVTIDAMNEVASDLGLPTVLPSITAIDGQTEFDVGVNLKSIQVNRSGSIEQTKQWAYNSTSGILTITTPASKGEEFEFTANVLNSSSIGDAGSIWFNGVSSMKANSHHSGAVDFAVLATNNDVVSTSGYYAGSNGSGWGHYKLFTLVDYRNVISDQLWTPDGDRNHYVGTGSMYVAILLPNEKGVEHAAQWGVITGDETAAVATENTRKLNAINAYLCPFEWKGSVQATYYDVALKGGICQFEQGFTCVNDTILWNPHVEYRGLNPVPRIFGKTSISAGEQLAYVKYVGVQSDIYVFDTANFKDSTGNMRLTDSKVSFFNSSIDAKGTSYSEGSFLRNLGIIPGAATGGFRLIAGMKGGYDGISVSGGVVSYMLSNCWNVTLGSIWTEESYFARLGFETTNLRFKGQTSSVGNSSTKLVIPDSELARIPSYFSSNFASDDDNTLPLVHLKQSKASFEAYCWDTVYDNLTTEFWANPICGYGNAGEYFLTINNWSEEGNAHVMDIDGNIGVKSVLITGFNAQIRLNEMSSISDTPLQALGTGSTIYVSSAKRWVGDTFYPDYMDNVVRGNPFVVENIKTLSPKIRRDHNVSIRGLKRDITFWCDDDTGSDLYLGVSSTQRGKINNIFHGIVQSSDSAGNYVYKPVNQSPELTIRLFGGTSGNVKDHGVGDDTGLATSGLSDGVRVAIVRDGGDAEWTRVVKLDPVWEGPVINNCEILFEGIVLRNTAITQPTLESNGLFRLTGINKIEMKGVTCQQTDSQDDGCVFTCMNGSYNTLSYREGNMVSMPKGLFSIVAGQQSVVDGIITSGVNSGKSSSNPTGLTDRVVNA